MEIDLVLERVRTGRPDRIEFAIPQEARAAFMILFADGVLKSQDRYRVRLSLPFRHRTTGKHSQSHRINGFLQQIAVATGIPFSGLKEWMKAESIGEGYPFVTMPDGTAMGKSEADISVEEASILIGTIQRVAAEWGIHLAE